MNATNVTDHFPVNAELQQVLQSIVKEASQSAIGLLQQELQLMNSTLSRVEYELRGLRLQADLCDQKMVEVTFSLHRLEDQMRGARRCLGDLDRRQQLVERFSTWPYVSGPAFVGAQSGEFGRDLSQISPYAQ